MSIRPPANYRVTRWLLLTVLVIAMLLSLLVLANGWTDLVTRVLSSG
jgi:hypothetical protein